LNYIHCTSSNRRSRHIILKNRTGKIKPASRSVGVVISETAKIGTNCRIGHFSKIGKYCRIGSNVTIGDSVAIEQNTTIGNNCRIQSGVKIGADGFSYERDEHSFELERFPHIGGVIIGNDVEISSNCSIARGSLSDTIVGDGTKIDALVHIAHNVEIGRNCLLGAGTVIGGSTKIGNDCRCGLNCTIKHKLRIGTNVTIGYGSSVITDVPDGERVEGVPAKSVKHTGRSKQLLPVTG
jgi:UDP-3-O-[3-hydroxymyristoyl] glucosamine N-acyltransferase